MAACRYGRWALIPADVDPATTGPMVYSPPMLPTLSVGDGSSLVFELDTAPARLEMRLETTGLSADGRRADCLRLFTGSEPDTYAETQSVEWEMVVAGLYATFTGRVTSASRYVKLVFPTGPDLVLTGITFEAI